MPKVTKLLAITSLGAMLAMPALAQNAAASAAADVAEQPVTQSLNDQVATTTQNANAINEANQHQYALDRAAYRAAIAARHEKMAIDDEAYARKEAAYADAMAAWRIQNDECKRGILKSCKKPTPVPADFY